MNKITIDRLKNNPHYKMSAKQRQRAQEEDREPMVEFGVPRIHNTQIDKHPTGLKRKAR